MAATNPLNFGTAGTGLTGGPDFVSVSAAGVARLTVGPATVAATLPVVLPADPTVALAAATKQYVDARDELRVAKTGDTITGNLAVVGTGVVLRGNNTNDGSAALINGLTKGVRFYFDGAQSNIDGVDSTGFASYQPLAIGGSTFSIHTGGVGRVSVNAAGDLTANAGAFKPGGGPWAATSDVRIKDVLGDYTGGLAEVVTLMPVRYVFKGNYSKRPDAPSPDRRPVEERKEFVGLIAQQAEASMPEMVTTETGYIDGEPVDDLRVLDTTALLFALVNCVKELNTRIAALEYP